jgi:transposase
MSFSLSRFKKHKNIANAITLIDVATLNKTHTLKYRKYVEINQVKQKVKIYSAEFRESSVKQAIGSDQPIAQTGRDLGINPNTLHTWINKYSQPKEQNKTVRTDGHLYEELKRLKKENARLIEECDLLKKAAAAYPSTSSGQALPGNNGEVRQDQTTCDRVFG